MRDRHRCGTSRSRNSPCPWPSTTVAELQFPTELIVSEPVTNAIRYGNAPIEQRLIRADMLI